MSDQYKCPGCGVELFEDIEPVDDRTYQPVYKLINGEKHYPTKCEIERLKAENERLRAELKDWRDSASVAANESCGDEKHCTCVPLLREENEMLRKIVEKLPELAGEFLREAEDIIRVWHGEEGWDIYREHSPEMTRLIDLAAKIATLGASEAANRSL